MPPPLDFAEAEGLLIGVDGFSPPIRWNGRDAAFVTAGLEPPATALTVSSSGIGPIVGTFNSFQRFLDALGNFSNLSPISNDHTAQNLSGTVTGATNATPIVITSVAHGLSTGYKVKVEGVGGNTDANGTFLATVTGADSFSLDGSSGNATYTGAGTFISGVLTILYTNVPTPTDPKVVLRQILRNTDGQEEEYYVDVETTDMGATSFSSTRDDETLSTQEAQAILDSKQAILANRHTPPPDTKTCLAFHQDRMLFFGEEDYTSGNVKVANGSATVRGVSTDWNASLIGRFLHVDDARDIYEIIAVNVDGQTLTLISTYGGTTDNFAGYAIRSSTYEAKQVLFSEAGEPESVVPTNALQIRQNGDRIRGGYSAGPYVYIVEERHVHRIIFGEDPIVDSGVFPASERGCINQRCWALLEGDAYMLDEQGCHVFSENGDKSISSQIQDIFRPQSKSRWRINWRARRHFHSVMFEQQDTMRWFVALAGCSRPKHALAYNFRLERWWIEEYPRPISASCVGRIDGIPVVFLGSDNRQVFCFSQGYQDFVDSKGAGTKRGTVTSATVTSLTDSTALFEPTAVGAYVHIVDGVGRSQSRRIVERTATTLTLNYPWLILPDTTSVYQVGGVSWRWRTKRFRLPESDKTQTTGFSVLCEPTEHAATLDVRQYRDFTKSGTVWKNPVSSVAGNRLRVDRDKAPWTLDLTKALGYFSKRIDRSKVTGLDGARFASWELSGVSNDEQVTIYELVLDGME